MDDPGQGRRSYQTTRINMSELEQTKYSAINSLKALCARCKHGMDHNCRVAGVIREIEGLNGIPVNVNSRLYHVVFN